jgi:hypothetical protein
MPVENYIVIEHSHRSRDDTYEFVETLDQAREMAVGLATDLLRCNVGFLLYPNMFDFQSDQDARSLTVVDRERRPFTTISIVG